MLVLTRRKEETIVIGDSIRITVLGIRGEQVRLGISAPPEIPVHRKEIYETLGDRTRNASSSNSFLHSLWRILRGRSDTARRPAAGNRRNQRSATRSRDR